MEYCVRKLIPRTPKIIIKTIINYFIGNYLLDELHEGQIEVIENYAQCSNIDLNIKVINDSFEKQNIPLNILYGFIGCIRIYLPGYAIDGKLLFEVNDLEISLGPIARSTTPDPDIVLGNMMDSMLNMQRSLHEEDLSNLIFEEKQKGKNFNALISKWISKLCLTLYNTRISFESQPIPQINRCCRFICEIEKLEFATRDIDDLNVSSSALLGILLANNIELTGFVLHWEVASQKCDNSINMTSLSKSTYEILYSSQILSIINPIQLNYTLLLNNTEPEFEVNMNVDTVHVLLAPLPLHWIQVLISQIIVTDYDPSISKNVKMTESQFDSFFTNEDKQSNSFRSPQNDSSIYYDLDSTFDGSSIHCTTYDDVALDNCDEDNPCYEFQRDTETCASLSSNVTLFDDEGKMNTNFKACISTKNVCVKVLLRNPSDDNDNWECDDDLLGRISDHKNWDNSSKKFYGLLKTFDKSKLSYEELIKFHSESGDIDYFSLFMCNVSCSLTNKKYLDKFHQSFLFAVEQLMFSETIYDGLKDPDTMQVISIISSESVLGSKALNIKAEYNPSKNEVSLEISLGRCYLGIDISIQDRVRLLLQNNIIEYGISDRTSSYELNRQSDSELSVGCIIVVNVIDSNIEVFIPLVNLNEEVSSKSYWQYRRLHSETIMLSIRNSRWLCRIPSTGGCDDKNYNSHTVVELYTSLITVSLCTVENLNTEILHLSNESEDFSMMIIKIKSKLEQHIGGSKARDSIQRQYESIFPYCNAKLPKKHPLKPYSTMESFKNNSIPKLIYTPESDEKIQQYIKKSINNSYFDVEIVSSKVIFDIQSKSVLETLYDRLVFDLALWEPCFDKRTNNVIINYKSEKANDTDEEANTDTSFDEDIHPSQKKHKSKFQSKKFTFKLRSECCVCYLQLNAEELQEAVIELKGIQLFTDSDIAQGFVETQSMFIMEVESGKIFHTDTKVTDDENNKFKYKTLTFAENYVRVLDRLPEHLVDGCSAEPREKMMVMIMESRLCTTKRTTRQLNRAKQNASTIVTANFNDVCLRVNYIHENMSGLEWLYSLSELFNLDTPVITGYNLPDSEVTMYLHSKNCAIDLCLSQLPLSVFALLNKVDIEFNLNSTESYCLSSELCFNGSQIFIRSNDNITLNTYFKWNNDVWLTKSVLDEGFVYIADLGSLDLRFNKIGSTNFADKTPNCTLTVTNSESGIHLCADSLNMIIACLTHLVSPITETPSQSKATSTSSLSTKDSFRRIESLPALNERQKSQFNNMINDAMKENKLSLKNNKQDSDEYCDDFILVEDIFSNVHDRVINLENNPSQKLSIVQDHYKSIASEDKYGNMNRAIFRDPDGYPNVENSLVVHDFSLSFYFYAGSDFGEINELKRQSPMYSKTCLKPSMNIPIKFQRFTSDNVPKVSIESSDFDAYFGEINRKTILTRGGTNRKLHEAYHWKFSKINFRYAIFSNTDWNRSVTCNKASRRVVFTVNTMEIMSHNKSSSINKLLFCDTNATLWYDPKSPMISMKMICTESDPYHDVVNEECDIRISIQPIRLNVDQEFVLFSEKFYKVLNTNDILNNKGFKGKGQRSYSTSTLPECIYQEKDSIIIPPNINLNKELGLGRGGGIDSISGCSPISRTSTLRMPAFDEMRCRNGNGEKIQPVHNTKSLSSIFIRNFSIYPNIYVRLDYTGTRLDLTQGAIKGLFYILMQLNNVVLVIKNKQYLEGITGLDILISILMKDITEEFYAQLKSIFSKVGPISEVTEILTGIYDFFTLPYLHYQNEGGLIEGIKLGTRSITTTSLWAALTLLSKSLKIFQKMAETTYDLVSPSDIGHGDDSYHSARDIREGVTNAAHGVRQRFRDTAADFQHAFVKSDRAIVGRIGDVIRQVPPALASPIVATCEATNHLVDGLRYQLKPEMKIEDEKKWKQ